MATLVFSIVMLHLLLGFGYVMYKLNFEKPKKEEETKSENNL